MLYGPSGRDGLRSCLLIGTGADVLYIRCISGLVKGLGALGVTYRAMRVSRVPRRGVCGWVWGRAWGAAPAVPPEEAEETGKSWPFCSDRSR